MYPDIVILVGSARSGTTFLSASIRKGLGIGIPAEPHFVVPTYRRLGRYGDLGRPENLQRLAKAVHETPVFAHAHEVRKVQTSWQDVLGRVREPTYTGVLYAAFDVLAEAWGHPGRLGYKDPGDVAHLPLLAELFPTARFVHVVRDGRDVASSLLVRAWGANNLYAGMRYWSRAVDKARRDGARLGARYHEVRYEDLMTGDAASRALAEFVEGGPGPRVDTFVAQIARTRKPASAYGWREKLTPEQRLLCDAVGAKTLAACGYEVGDSTRGPSRARAVVYLASDAALRLRNRLRRGDAPDES